MDSDKTRSQLLYEQVVTIQALPRPKKEPERPTDTENAVCGDDAVPLDERAKYKTPLAVLDAWAQEQTFAFKKSIPQISILKSYREWNATAHLEIETPAVLSNEGLELHFSVSCDPRYMAQPRDLIPIFLETPGTNANKPGDPQLMVVVIEPTWDYNHWEIKVRYTLAELAKALKINATGALTADTITGKFPEVGLRAQWFGVVGQQMPQVNGVRHESGGLDQKGGSGKLRLVPYTEQELAGTENRRNTSWNMSEKLNTSRPVFVRYRPILQGGKEMMTTLECESEYRVASERDLDSVIKEMKTLLKDTGMQKAFGIVKMSGEKKHYTDTYFDLPSPCDLLANKIVLRRRHRSTDVSGTYLFALKGATHVDGPRRLRLAAQVQLMNTALTTDKNLLRQFLSFETVDNPFCRTLLHALKNNKPAITRLSNEDIAETLEIESDRETFTMTLADGTQIDFSADKASGRPLPHGKPITVYSFEFGVGHPALTQAATTGGGTVAGGEGEGEGKKKVSVKERMNQFEAPKPEIIRPYHVPADLTNPEIFQKVDYKQFVELRDIIITKVFQLDPNHLELGGNKGHDLAKLHGLI